MKLNGWQVGGFTGEGLWHPMMRKREKKHCWWWLHYLFSTAITLVTVLMNWPPVFHLQWLGHVPHVRQHLTTTIVWNSPMRELIGSVMVSSLLLPTFGTLPSSVFPPSFNLPSLKRQVYHHLRGLMAWFFLFSITLFRCFLLTLFRYFIKLFYYTSFPFSRDADSRKGTFCPFWVPIHKRKKKKKSFKSMFSES